MKKIIIIAILVIFVGAGIFIWSFLSGLGKPLSPGDEKTVAVEIMSGSGTSTIAEVLVDNGIIDSAFKFKVYSKLNDHDGTYKAGKYTLSPSMSYDEIISIIASGVSNSASFTIPEGLTIYETAEKLAEQGMGDKDVFVKLIEEGNFDYPFLQYSNDGKNKLEGYLLPNTYSVDEGASEEEVIRVFLDHFQREIYDGIYLPLKESPEDNLAKKYDINQIVTIASIIERECKLDVERSTVSSVIQNRLDIGMPLQMDSTVTYVLNKKSLRVTYEDLEVDSLYNTYKYPGIPPGAICSPRAQSIEAALKPASTNYLYFVVSAKLDGSMEYSETYEKFEKDKAAFYEAYDAAGGE